MQIEVLFPILSIVITIMGAVLSAFIVMINQRIGDIRDNLRLMNGAIDKKFENIEQEIEKIKQEIEQLKEEIQIIKEYVYNNIKSKKKRKDKNK